MIHTIQREVEYNGEIVSKVRFEISAGYPDIAVIHQDVYKWSIEIFKLHLALLTTTTEIFKQKGFKKFICTLDKDDPRAEKAVRYWRKFGFQVYISDALGPEIYFGELEM